MRPHPEFFPLFVRGVFSAEVPCRAVILTVFSLALACSSVRPPSIPVAAQQGESRPPPARGGGAVPSTLPTPPLVKTIATGSIGAVGDVLMHGAVKDTASDHRSSSNDEGFGWLWEPIADLLAATDLTFANLESPIAPRHGGPGRSFVFNAPPALLSALRKTGVNLVAVANNHLFDQGRSGFLETVEQLEAAGLPYIGAGKVGAEAGPRLMSVGGLRVAFLAYTYSFNQSGNDCPPVKRPDRPCLRASVFELDRAIADVRAASRAADAVIVSLHWGVEYEQVPREADIDTAHRLAEAGALVILGHHPHVLQPIELFTRADGSTALIAYSLGNFISNQSRHYQHGVTPARIAATRDGVLLRAVLAKRDYGRGVVRVELAACEWIPLWTENDTASPTRQARRARPSIRVVSLDRALSDVRTELAALPDPLPAAARAPYIDLRRREDLYLSRRAAMAAVLGEDLVAPLPPPAPR